MSELKDTLKLLVDEKNQKIIPENIKKGINIYGVLGTYEGDSGSYIDTTLLKNGGSLSNCFVNCPPIDMTGRTNISNMFLDCTNLTNVVDLDLTNITTAEQTFKNCYKLSNINLLNTENLKYVREMFMDCGITKCPNIDKSPLSIADSLFEGCTKMKLFPTLNTSNCTSMKYMFKRCIELTDVPMIDTSKCTSLYGFCQQCSHLFRVPLLDTRNVTEMTWMFAYVPNLDNKSLDNILQMCINSKCTGNKKCIADIFYTHYYEARFKKCPHWQEFINAGWTMEYPN